jgi:hypothetical protein
MFIVSSMLLHVTLQRSFLRVRLAMGTVKSLTLNMTLQRCKLCESFGALWTALPFLPAVHSQVNLQGPQ